MRSASQQPTPRTDLRRAAWLLSVAALAVLVSAPEAWAQPKQNAAVLSVITVRNQTPQAITYEVKWPGAKEETFTVRAGEFRLHSAKGEAVRGNIAFQDRGTRQVRDVNARDYQAGKGPPSQLGDGQLFCFRHSSNGGIVLVEEFPFDKTRFPKERGRLESARERKNFPFLMTNYEVLGPSGRPYNCISWTIGVTERGTWPGSSIAAFDALYAKYGYTRGDTMDFSLQRGVHKLALYGHGKVPSISATHGARQEPDGSWTSKLGPLALIRHLHLEDLNGPFYGHLVAMYWKKI